MLTKLSLLAVAAGGMASCRFNKVHAATVEGNESLKTIPKKIRPSELPIYGEPELPELELIPPQETSFHRKVSTIRKWTWSYMDSIKDTTDTIKEKIDVAEAHTNDALNYLRADTNTLPRIAVITVAGLGGIVAGYRGGKVKKTFLATLGMAAAASVCYPHEAMEISGIGVQGVKSFVKETYRDIFPSAVEERSSITETEELVTEVVEKPSSTIEKEELAAVNESIVQSIRTVERLDRDMSKPEDKDMYTTRDG